MQGENESLLNFLLRAKKEFTAMIAITATNPALSFTNKNICDSKIKVMQKIEVHAVLQCKWKPQVILSIYL